MENKNAVIIGSGFGGLATACILGKAGYDVTVFEKNEQLGGRASVFESDGFRFDMGPSWYLMPDIFEQFFELLGEDVHAHLSLQKLQPSYRIFFKDTDFEPMDFFADLQRDAETFEQLEPGSSKQLEEYLRRAKEQYEIARDRFIYKNYDSFLDFFTWELMKDGTKLSVFSNMHRYVAKYFKTDPVQKIMQYTLVFLGSSPYNTPAIYNIMSHIDFNMGVFYPQGGINEIVKALETIANKYNVQFRTNAPVKRISTQGNKATGVELQDGSTIEADVVISNADIHHTEMHLLPEESRAYSDRYWKKRVLSPSAFMLYLGVSKRIPALEHHSLIFSKDWQKNFGEIFDQPDWPTDPSLYICTPSKTDPSVAPEGNENMFILVPVAPNLPESTEQLDAFEEQILETVANEINEPELKKHIVFKRRFTGSDFEARYNSFQGTALGLAHTLRQTAIFRPNNTHPKLTNLYYVGANTNPGIGMPMCLISAQLLYKRLTGDKSSGPLKTL